MNDQRVKQIIRALLQYVAMGVVALTADVSFYFRVFALVALMQLSASLYWLWEQWNSALALSAFGTFVAELVTIPLLWFVARLLDRKDWRRIRGLQIAFSLVLLWEVFAIAAVVIAIGMHTAPLEDALGGIVLQLWNGSLPVGALKTLQLFKTFKPEK